MRIFLSVILIATAMLANACGGGPTANNGTNNAAKPNTNGAPANGNSLVPTPKPVAATTNNAPNLGAVIQAYYEALKKKDDAAVKATMSAGFIKKTEDDMKEESKKGSFAVFLAETDTIPDKPLEVRNEKIEGDKGVCEAKGGAYLNWTPFAFVNEGGKWKLTGGSPEIDAVKSQDTTGK